MIGHMKNDGLLERCHLKGTEGDALHALLCAVGHNLWLLRAWWHTLLLWLCFRLSMLTNRPVRDSEFAPAT